MNRDTRWIFPGCLLLVTMLGCRPSTETTLRPEPGTKTASTAVTIADSQLSSAEPAIVADAIEISQATPPSDQNWQAVIFIRESYK